MAFFPSDDGLVEGVHSIDIMHSIVSANADKGPVFAGSVQMEIRVGTLDNSPSIFSAASMPIAATSVQAASALTKCLV